MQITVEDLEFREALQKYEKLTHKGMGVILNEQARLLAKRLMQLTPPNSKSQGNKRVAIDIGRVYLRNSWFEEVFHFNKESLQNRVKALVLAKNVGDLQAIFQNSSRLNRLHIEPFDASKHAAARRDGRVNYPNPFSFPLTDQGKVNKYVKEKQRNVGLAKAGWGSCLAFLQGSVPAWLNKDNGVVNNQSELAENPFITMTNLSPYFGRLNEKADIVDRALAGRSADMIKSAEAALKRAAAEAGLE